MRALVACQTQWRINDYNGQRLGLDYGAAKIAVEAAGLKWEGLFFRLRELEHMTMEEV